MPVFLCRALRCRRSNFEPPDHFVASYALVIKQHYFQTQVFEAFVIGLAYVENEALVEYRRRSALFDVRLFLRYALPLVK